MNGVAQIQLGSFLLAYVLLLAVLAVMKKCRIHQARLLVLASMRMTLQLVAAGYALTFLFDHPHPLLTVAYLVVLVFFTIYLVLSRNKRLNAHFRLVVALAIAACGLGVVVFFVVCIVRQSIFDPQYMKIYAVNGGPRKKHNTGKLLQAALDAAAASGAGTVETEMINVYDLEFQGCTSCFACKRLGGKSYGRCGFKDALTPVLEKLSQADGIIFGSPIYFGSITGKLRCLLERLLFPYLVYDQNYSSIAPKRMISAAVTFMV